MQLVEAVHDVDVDKQAGCVVYAVHVEGVEDEAAEERQDHGVHEDEAAEESQDHGVHEDEAEEESQEDLGVRCQLAHRGIFLLISCFHQGLLLLLLCPHLALLIAVAEGCYCCC